MKILSVIKPDGGAITIMGKPEDLYKMGKFLVFTSNDYEEAHILDTVENIPQVECIVNKDIPDWAMCHPRPAPAVNYKDEN